jgi:hypothetical protein
MALLTARHTENKQRFGIDKTSSILLRSGRTSQCDGLEDYCEELGTDERILAAFAKAKEAHRASCEEFLKLKEKAKGR